MLVRLFRIGKTLAAFALAFFIGSVALLYVSQDRLIFQPPSIVVTDAGNDHFDTVSITTSDGETLSGFHHPAEAGETTVLVFHGNASAAAYVRPKGSLLVESGFGVLLVEYRGYPGSTGTPSEGGLFEDGRAAYEFVNARTNAPIALYATSLGTGVAVQLAAEREVAAMVLEAPFDSLMAVAQGRYPWAPVSLLLRHPFRSDLQIGKTTAPILIMHGGRDSIVPVEHGRRLAELARAGTRFVEFPDARHNDLASFGSIDLAIEFLKEVTGR